MHVNGVRQTFATFRRKTPTSGVSVWMPWQSTGRGSSVGPDRQIDWKCYVFHDRTKSGEVRSERDESRLETEMRRCASLRGSGGSSKPF